MFTPTSHKEETRFCLISNYRTMRNLLVADGRGGHKQAGESGHSGVDRAPFTKAAGLTILHRIAGHRHEQRRGLGRKSVVIRFRPLRSWGVQISLGCSRWRRGKISEAPRSWPSKEPANEFDGNYLIIIDRRDESYPTPGLSALLHRDWRVAPSLHLLSDEIERWIVTRRFWKSFFFFFFFFSSPLSFYQDLLNIWLY